MSSGETVTRPAKQKLEAQPRATRKGKQNDFREAETSLPAKGSKKTPQNKRKSEGASGGVHVKRQKGDYSPQQPSGFSAGLGRLEGRSVKRVADLGAQQQLTKNVRNLELIKTCASLHTYSVACLWKVLLISDGT